MQGAIQDARRLPESRDADADVVVVGSGPAGLTVADQLTKTGLRVTILESGGPDLDPAVQQLGAGPFTGDAQYGDVRAQRRRQVGGTATAWTIPLPRSSHGVRLAELTEADLQPTADRPGWPVSRRELDEDYAAAWRAFGLDGPPPDAEGPDLGAELQARSYGFGAGEMLSHRLRDAVLARPHLDLVHHATATAVAPAVGGGPRRLSVTAMSAPGRRHLVHADAVVLAAGGIEVPRLLLASAAAHPGLSLSPLVGRGLMDHPMAHGGMWWANDPRELASFVDFDLRARGDMVSMGFLALDDGGAAGRVAVAARLLPRPAGHDPVQLAAIREAVKDRRLLAALRAVARAPHEVRSAWYAYRGWWPDVEHGGWSSSPQRYAGLAVILACEQLPHDDNRVTLSEQRDALGQPRAHVTWRWHERDRAAAGAAVHRLRQEVTERGLGRIEPIEKGPKLFGGTHHHMGTARMGTSAENGVVDRDGQVFGLPGVFVASSAVFPSGGAMNPTLTIVALARRTARAVAADLGR